MTRILFVRHAEADHMQHPDYVAGRAWASKLTAGGRRKAPGRGRELNNSVPRIDQIYCSPSKRAVETARLLGVRAWDPELHIDERLDEMSLGSFEGMLRTEVYTPAVIAQIAIEQTAFAFPGTESMDDVADRMLSWTDEIHHEHPSGTIVAVSHRLAIRCMVGRIQGWSNMQIRDAGTEALSITQVDVEDGTPKVRSGWNSQ